MDTNKMSAALDLLALGLSYSEVSRRLGLDRKTLFNWRVRSRKGDEKLMLEWGDFGPAQFEDHLKSADAMAFVHLESKAREAATVGFEEQVIFQGAEQFKLDRRQIARLHGGLLETGFCVHGEAGCASCASCAVCKSTKMPCIARVFCS